MQRLPQQHSPSIMHGPQTSIDQLSVRPSIRTTTLFCSHSFAALLYVCSTEPLSCNNKNINNKILQQLTSEVIERFYTTNTCKQKSASCTLKSTLGWEHNREMQKVVLLFSVFFLGEPNATRVSESFVRLRKEKKSARFNSKELLVFAFKH